MPWLTKVYLSAFRNHLLNDLFSRTFAWAQTFLWHLPTNCAFVEDMYLAGFFICSPPLESMLQTVIPSPLKICSIAISMYKYKSTILCDNVHEMTTCSPYPLRMNLSPSCPGFLSPQSFPCTQLNLLMWFAWQFLIITPKFELTLSVYQNVLTSASLFTPHCTVWEKRESFSI